MIQKKLLNNNNNNNNNNKNNQQMNIFILPFLLLTLYVIGNNIFYLSAAYADLPEEINKIQDCKNAKIIDKALSKSNSRDNDNNNNNDDTQSIANFHHIKKFDSNGKLIYSWGIKGTGDGEFLHPHGIGSDSKGNIFVSDAVLCNIQKFDNNGRYLLKFGSRGNGPAEFLQPESIAIDKNDNLFIVDFASQHVQ